MKMLVHWGGHPEFEEEVEVDDVSFLSEQGSVWVKAKNTCFPRAWLPEPEIAPDTRCYVWDGDVKPERPAMRYYVGKDSGKHLAAMGNGYDEAIWDHAEPVLLKAPIVWKLIASKMDVIDWQSGLTIVAPIGLWKIGARGGDDTVIAVHHRPEAGG